LTPRANQVDRIGYDLALICAKQASATGPGELRFACDFKLVCLGRIAAQNVELATRVPATSWRFRDQPVRHRQFNDAKRRATSRHALHRRISLQV
jgi:hypothetical protein